MASQLPYRARSFLGAIGEVPRTILTVLRDDLLGKGVAGGSSVVVRFLGIALRYPIHRSWLRTVRRDATRQLVEAHPRFIYRYTSAYLFIGASWRQRARMIEAHYRFVNASYGPEFFAGLLTDGGVPFWTSTIQQRTLSIRLLGPCMDPAHREGDMTLAFMMDDLTLYKAAFSVIGSQMLEREPPDIDADGDRVMYVGQIHGAYGNFEGIREATKLCSDIAPQDVLMSALAGLADAWRIDRIFGVHSAQHLCAQRKPVSLTAFDYCAFWARYRGTPSHTGHFVIDLPFQNKPIEEIASKHRKRTQVKRDFKRAVQHAVAKAALDRSCIQGAD